MTNHSGEKNLQPNSWFKLVFGLMNPPKEGVFTNIGKNFAKTLQFEDLAVNIFFSILLGAYFCEKNSEFISKCFMNGEEKNLKHFVEKSFSLFEGTPFKPSNKL